MRGMKNRVVGVAKEVAGAITDNNKLRAEGQAEQAVGKAKDLVEKVADKVQDVAGKVSDKVQHVVHKATS